MSGKLLSHEASQLYRFKDIVTVPSASDLVDIVLSMTQRKTPTETHPQYDIRRIRTFYMRKVKFAQTTFHEKLGTILEGFPKIDDIHPFYADLCNVLYDKDHYKIALGQVNSVRNAVDALSKEYVRLLKYADSPYKCKMLKRAALGRACTCVRKLKPSLAYLEEVRKHLSRLPGINPFHQTILLAGFPNVGKSTYMNALSRANVETAEWAFTTKSLYLGHFDYQYQRWQVVDTPGILDRPLSSRNTIELSAITAMAHLSAAILYLVDISEACGHSIAEQVQLFHTLRALLQHKPVVVCLNKTDLRDFSALSPQEVAAIKGMAQGFDLIDFVAISTLQQQNLDEAKNKACDMLNALRRQKRLLSGKSAGSIHGQPLGGDIISQLYVSRSAIDPARAPGEKPSPGEYRAGLVCKEAEEDMTDGKKLSAKERAELEGGAGVYRADPREGWLLENDEWRYDIIPEFFDGKNVADFVDPDIDAKLRALEEEEAALVAAWDKTKEAPTSEFYDVQDANYEVYLQRENQRLLSKLKKHNRGRIQARRELNSEDFKERLAAMNVDAEPILARITKNLHVTGLTPRSGQDPHKVRPSRLELAYGINNIVNKRKIEKDIMRVNKRYVHPKKSQPKWQINESDRFIGNLRPKHLYSGKRGVGKTDRR